MLAATEYGSARARAGWIERDAKHVDAARPQAENGAPRVLDQIARIDHVDVRRLAVGKHEDQLAMATHSCDLSTGVAQRRSEPRREVRFEMGQPRLDVCTVELPKFLETKHPDVFAACRRKCAYRERVAKRGESLGQRRHCQPFQVEHRGARRDNTVARRFRTSTRIVTARSRLRRIMVRKTRSSGISSARNAMAASNAASRSSSGPSLRRFSRSAVRP